jgi:hypothetical protein
MTLSEVRASGQAVKIFVQENQGCEHMRLYLSVKESMVREMEAMIVSARTLQTDLHDFCFASACCTLCFTSCRCQGRLKCCIPAVCVLK